MYEFALVAFSAIAMTYTFILAWRSQQLTAELAERVEGISKDAFAQLKAQSLGEKVAADVQVEESKVQVELLKDALHTQHEEIVNKKHAKSAELIYTDSGKPLDLNEWEIA